MSKPETYIMTGKTPAWMLWLLREYGIVRGAEDRIIPESEMTEEKMYAFNVISGLYEAVEKGRWRCRLRTRMRDPNSK